MRNLAIALGFTVALIGCNGEPQTPPSLKTPTSGEIAKSDTYAVDMKELAALVGEYVRHWDTNKRWPAPGTYQSANLIYKGSEPTSGAFPDRRRDFYRTLHRGGLELDLCLWSDGRYEVAIIRDCEP